MLHRNAMRAVAGTWNKKIASLTDPISSSTPPALFHLAQVVFLSSRSSKPRHPEERGSQDSSKTHVRFAVREKRTDAQNAVKDLLSNGKSFQSGDSERSQRQKKLKARHSQEKRWQKRKAQDENKSSFRWTWGGETFTFGNSNPNGFEWRDDSSNWNQDKFKSKFLNESDLEEEGEEQGRSNGVDLMMYRVALDLPRTGPLNIDHVKSAFRLAALKWHPDKHQGTSKEIAEEKFKCCVDAYNALSRSLTKP